jgi:hypothetical protein
MEYRSTGVLVAGFWVKEGKAGVFGLWIYVFSQHSITPTLQSLLNHFNLRKN